MSPLYVRPYVKVHKTDDRDAEAIAEAASRSTMSFVTVKSASAGHLFEWELGIRFFVEMPSAVKHSARGMVLNSI